jgi:hypothetical protein
MPSEIRARATLDKSQMSTGLRGLTAEFNNLSASKGARAILEGVGLGAGLAATSAITAGVAKMADVISDSISDASRLNEQMARSRVVFGDVAGEMASWASDAADAFGLSQRAALEASSGFGQFFQAAGKTQSGAAEMAKTMVALSADLASFNDLAGGSPEALEKLRAGLAGEAEPLRRLGVFLTAAKVQAKAMQLGLADASGEISEGAKIIARYNIILDETKLAQGDFARTSDGLANSQRSLAADMENLSAELGQALIPFAQEMVRTFREDLIPAIRQAGVVLGELNPQFDEFGQRVKAPQSDLEKIDQGLRDIFGAFFNAGRGVREYLTAYNDWDAILHPTIDDTAALSGGVFDLGRHLAAERAEANLATESLARLDTTAAMAAEPVKDLGDAAEDAAGDFDKLADAITDAAVAAGEARYGPAQLRGELAELEQQLIDDQTELKNLEAIKNPTAEQRRDIIITKGRIAETREEILKTRVQMALLDGTGLDALIKEVGILARRGGAAGDEFRELLRLMKLVKAQEIVMQYGPSFSAPGHNAGRHTGGSMIGGPAGGTYSVGEGPGGRGETVTMSPGSSAWVTPGQQFGGSSGGSPVVIQLVVDGRVIAELVDQELYYDAKRAPRAPTPA